jgi:hypothetical protein
MPAFGDGPDTVGNPQSSLELHGIAPGGDERAGIANRIGV